MDKNEKELLNEIVELRKKLEDWLIKEVTDDRYVHSTAKGLNEAIDKLCWLEDRLKE